jgi:hypothetical protein
MDNHLFIFEREGTSRTERFPEPLSFDYARIDERSLIDLVKQSAEYARFVKYYGSNDMKAEGDWRDLFNEIYDYKQQKVRFSTLEELEKQSTVSPHIALFLSFLRVFGIAQQSLNMLTKKHLDFYYREILKIESKKPQSDTVALFLEPNKASRRVMVPAGTLFAAGNDANGKPLQYATKNDLVVNQAKIETPLRNNEEAAIIGFAIASSQLYLKDGTRTVKFQLGENISNSFINQFKAEYTSEKGWEPAKISIEKETIQLTIDAGQVPVTVYKEAVHQAGFNATHPVIRFVLKAPMPLNKEPLLPINNWVIEGVQIEVKDSKDLIVSNKYGVVNNEKAFFPFGMHPAVNDELSIVNPIIFNKNLSVCKINRPLRNIDNENITLEETPSEDKRNATNGNILITLKYIHPDYDPSTYPKRLAEAILSYNQGTSKPGEKPNLPSQPNAPEMDYLSVDYEAAVPAFDLFCIHPYGYDKMKCHRLYFDELVQGKASYFGMDGLEPPAVLSLYLDIKADLSHRAGDGYSLQWWYLNENDWVLFRNSDILLDTTSGFTKSGCVYLNMTGTSLTEHTVLPDGKVWIKLSSDTGSFPQIESVSTQVVEAVLVDNGNELSHLEKGLPAGTITKPVTAIQGIRSVKQPYSSFGGRAEESERAYYTRVSELLRHKNRAWNIWDYERLVLENFPEIHKVKCIPYTDANGAYAPGKILLVVIPDEPVLQPVVGDATIHEIKAFIKKHSSPFVANRDNIQVDNPKYEEVRVACTVSFGAEFSDGSYYRDRLKEDLILFLSPWMDNRSTVDFRTSITPAQIVYFIETREYIDSVDLLEVKVKAGGKYTVIPNSGTIKPSAANAVLTSDSSHDIKS